MASTDCATSEGSCASASGLEWCGGTLAMLGSRPRRALPRVVPLLPCPQGDIVLLGLREFQDQKADIILKYDGGARREGHRTHALST